MIHFPGRLPAVFRALRPADAVKRSLLDGIEDRSMLGVWRGSTKAFGAHAALLALVRGACVVLGFGFCGWTPAKAVHEPGLVSLYQLTHAEVMFSKSERVSIGPLRNGEPSRTHSVL